MNRSLKSTQTKLRVKTSTPTRICIIRKVFKLNFCEFFRNVSNRVQDFQKLKLIWATWKYVWSETPTSNHFDFSLFLTCIFFPIGAVEQMPTIPFPKIYYYKNCRIIKISQFIFKFSYSLSNRLSNIRSCCQALTHTHTNKIKVIKMLPIPINIKIKNNNEQQKITERMTLKNTQMCKVDQLKD